MSFDNKKQRYLRIWIILLMVPLTGASIDIYVPSLPAIQTYFTVSASLAQFTIPAYVLGYSLSQLFLGALSDALGRKHILIAGLLAYTLISLYAPYSPSISILIIVRFLQGVAVAAPGVLSRAIASDSFDKNEMPVVMNYITIAWACGPILAPAIGGYLQAYVGWQAPFYFLAGFGLLNLLLVSAFIPETHRHPQPLKLQAMFGSYKKILSHPLFLGGTLISAMIYGYLIFFNVAGPFLIQNVLNYSPVVFGHMALLLGLAWFSGSVFNRIFMRYVGASLMINASILVSLLAGVSMWLIAMQHHLNLAVLIIPVAILFFSASITFTNYFGKCLGLFPDRAGAASSMLGSLISSGAALAGIVASLLKEDTQLPLASAYVIMVLVSLLITWFIRKAA